LHAWRTLRNRAVHKVAQLRKRIVGHHLGLDDAHDVRRAAIAQRDALGHYQGLLRLDNGGSGHRRGRLYCLRTRRTNHIHAVRFLPISRARRLTNVAQDLLKRLLVNLDKADALIGFFGRLENNFRLDLLRNRLDRRDEIGVHQMDRHEIVVVRPCRQVDTTCQQGRHKYAPDSFSHSQDPPP
jgi:hypothetical protein